MNDNTEEDIFDADKLVNTAKELREWLFQLSADLPIVVCIDGHFGYVTNIGPALASTWDNNRVWVLTKEEADVSEYPVKEALEDKRLVPVIYLQCQREKNESS